MQTTNQELIDFSNAASRYLTTSKVSTKLTYALAKMQQRAKKPLTKFDEAMNDARLENALSDDKTKALLLGPEDKYQFSKEGMAALAKRQRELLSEPVEIEPYFATEVPAELRDDFRVAFEGFVIQEGEPLQGREGDGKKAGHELEA